VEKDPLPSLTRMPKVCNDFKKDLSFSFFLAPCADLPFLALKYYGSGIYAKVALSAISPLFSDHRKCFDMLFIY
jgi:hypothetical protein